MYTVYCLSEQSGLLFLLVVFVRRIFGEGIPCCRFLARSRSTQRMPRPPKLPQTLLKAIGFHVAVKTKGVASCSDALFLKQACF